MFRTANSPYDDSSNSSCPQGLPRCNRTYTFPNFSKQAINTIEEDVEDSEFSGQPPQPPFLGLHSQDQSSSSSINPFEKSFQSLDPTKPPICDSNSPFAGLEHPPMLAHTKSGSSTSASSVDTISSSRTKRFSRSSSTSSFSDSSSSSSSLPTLSFFKKPPKFPIQDPIKLISNDEVASILEEPNVLVVDVRPFIDFSKSHVKNSINFNLPSTLLRRKNFTLQKCLNNLASMENFRLKRFLYEEIFNENKKIVVYDDSPIINNEVSSGINGVLNKFIEFGDNKNELFVLSQGFPLFKKEFSDLVEFHSAQEDGADCEVSSTLLPSAPPQYHSHSFSNSSIKSMPLLPPDRSLLLGTLNSSAMSPDSSFGSFSSSNSFSTPTSEMFSPNLSRFQLPKLSRNPVFKIRHNEETYGINNDSILTEFKYLHPNNDQKPKHLPHWLQNQLPSNDPKPSHISLFEKFKTLEMNEKKRINEMVTSNSIGCGIELGMKNRYKDIFPYEHSRVKLSVTQTSECSLDSGHNDGLSYINANFISCPKLTGMRYIATQAPLLETSKDFNKLINDNDVDVIISLTSQFENGVEKCYPYWNESSIYEIVQVQEVDNIIIRRLKIVDGSSMKKEVLQMQILNWMDYDIMDSCRQKDVLKLVYFKKLILEKLKIWHNNVIVHCSAGCGRTGTFCTLDTIINVENHGDARMTEAEMRKNGEEKKEEGADDDDDLVYDIVEKFRNQRISMVQNLRQYLFIYDCLCNYFENFKTLERFNKDFKDLNILNSFIDQRLVDQRKGRE